MFTNRLFYLLIVLALLVVTGCAPKIEATPAATLTLTAEPTVVPTATSTIVPTATTAPTVIPSVTPTAVPTEVGSFPIGKFFHANDPTAYYTFKDGKWGHFAVGAQFALATGTYRVEENIYFQLTNSHGCPPMSFKYSFDGKYLKFQLTEESQNDTCGDRKDFYNNKTYILSP